MTRHSQVLPRDRFLPLPRPLDEAGAPRRVGVEIEFAGLTESEAAAIVARRWGGTVEAAAPYEMTVRGTALGDFRIHLDTALRKGRDHALAQMGLKLGREVIPVEIVTDPLPAERLVALETLRADLREAGALGSRHGMLLSFGLHFNIEVSAERVETIRPVLTAFALIEDWLRLHDPMDGARRLLPFVDPYPRRFVRALLALPPAAGMGDLIDLYLRLTPTRNRALDMLPLFRRIDPARVESTALNLDAIRPRPTYHYRLPDSRVDEARWRLAQEWNRWVLVERVADDAGTLATLAQGWVRYHAARGANRRGWCAEAGRILEGAALSGGDAA